LHWLICLPISVSNHSTLSFQTSCVGILTINGYRFFNVFNITLNTLLEINTSIFLQWIIYYLLCSYLGIRGVRVCQTHDTKRVLSIFTMVWEHDGIIHNNTLQFWRYFKLWLCMQLKNIYVFQTQGRTKRITELWFLLVLLLLFETYTYLCHAARNRFTRILCFKINYYMISFTLEIISILFIKLRRCIS